MKAVRLLEGKCDQVSSSGGGNRAMVFAKLAPGLDFLIFSSVSWTVQGAETAEIIWIKC